MKSNYEKERFKGGNSRAGLKPRERRGTLREMSHRTRKLVWKEGGELYLEGCLVGGKCGSTPSRARTSNQKKNENSVELCGRKSDGEQERSLLKSARPDLQIEARPRNCPGKDLKKKGLGSIFHLKKRTSRAKNGQTDLS